MDFPLPHLTAKAYAVSPSTSLSTRARVQLLCIFSVARGVARGVIRFLQPEQRKGIASLRSQLRR